MAPSTTAFAKSLSIPIASSRSLLAPLTLHRPRSTKLSVIPPRRVGITSVAKEKHLTASESSLTAAPSTHDTHPVVTTNFDPDTDFPEGSCISSLDDVSELVDIAEEAGLADLRISHNGFTVEITLSGGLGFGADGCLKDPPSTLADSQSGVSMDQFVDVTDDGLGTAVSSIVESNGNTSSVEALSVESASSVEEKNPDEIYDSDFVVTSDRVGFFFSGAKNKPPLVNVGDTVTFNQPVCIIEQLGQQYVYLSEAAGKVVKILLEDADSVEYGTQIMVIRPE